MKIVAITCSMVMWLASIFTTAVPLPYLPYVPPNDAQLWDMVFNIFGITAPQIEDAEERAAAYWNIYRDALGAGYDAFAQDMQEAFDNARTGGSLVLGAGTGLSLGMIETGMESALNNGVNYGEEIQPIVQYQELKNELEKDGISVSLADITNMVETAQYNLGFDVAMCYLWGKNGSSNTILFGFYNKANIATLKNTSPYKWQVSGNTYIIQRSITAGGVVGSVSTSTRYSIELSSYWNVLYKYGNYGKKVNKMYVLAQSAATAAAIGAKTLVPVTAETVLNNGVIDDTKPVKIRLPLNDLPVGATDLSGLAGVQDKVDAVPNTEVQDLSETIQEMQEKQAATYGDTGAFAVDLTSYFPFCIPFDLYKMLLALGAEPEAPSIDFPMITGIEDGEIQTVNMHISLEFMDELMSFIRIGELIFANIGMAMLTAKVIKW